MSAARYQPTMTLLDDGRVLVAGGSGDHDNLGAVPLASAEVFNPDTGTLSDAAAMSAGRVNATPGRELSWKRPNSNSTVRRN